MEGTGSVLQGCTDASVSRSTPAWMTSALQHAPPVVCDAQVEGVCPSLDRCSEEEKVQRLQQLRLRYFTPREVANLMGFPQSFSKLPCTPSLVVTLAVPSTLRSVGSLASPRWDV